MRKVGLLVVACTLALGVSTGNAGAQPSAVFDGDPVTTERIDSGDPVTAAVRISEGRFSDQAAPYAVLSRDDQFADSLAAAPLTAAGPLLLTPSMSLSDGTRHELRRAVQPGGTIYLLGGVEALSSAVEQQVTEDGFEPVRLQGAGRIQTAVAVAREVNRLSPGDVAAIARAGSPADNPSAAWADSVTGGGWAAEAAVPVLLTGTGSLDADTASALEDIAEEVVILGGEAAIAREVEDDLADRGLTPRRIAGFDRAGTAAAVARELRQQPDPRRYLVIHGYRDDGWAYGLAAAGLSAERGAPVLVAGEDVPTPTTDLVSTPCDTPAAVDIALVGGASILGQQVVDALDAVDGGPCLREVELRGEGLRDDLPFGTPLQMVVDQLTALYGEPTRDTGWQVECEFAGDDQARTIVWADVLAATFVNPDDPVLDRWAYVGGQDALGLATLQGLTLGATNAQIRDTYGASATFEDDPVFGPFWYIEPQEGGTLYAFMSGNADSDVAMDWYGGDVVFCD